VQKEVERQNAAEEEAARRTVEKAIQEAQEMERPMRPEIPAVLSTSGQPPAPVIPNGQYEQESEPNLAQ
jgi:hypothetical protein